MVMNWPKEYSKAFVRKTDRMLKDEYHGDFGEASVKCCTMCESALNKLYQKLKNKNNIISQRLEQKYFKYGHYRSLTFGELLRFYKEANIVEYLTKENIVHNITINYDALFKLNKMRRIEIHDFTKNNLTTYFDGRDNVNEILINLNIIKKKFDTYSYERYGWETLSIEELFKSMEGITTNEDLIKRRLFGKKRRYDQDIRQMFIDNPNINYMDWYESEDFNEVEETSIMSNIEYIGLIQENKDVYLLFQEYDYDYSELYIDKVREELSNLIKEKIILNDESFLTNNNDLCGEV